MPKKEKLVWKERLELEGKIVKMYQKTDVTKIGSFLGLVGKFFHKTFNVMYINQLFFQSLQTSS